jgi:hypothetical protein
MLETLSNPIDSLREIGATIFRHGSEQLPKQIGGFLKLDVDNHGFSR